MRINWWNLVIWKLLIISCIWSLIYEKKKSQISLLAWWMIKCTCYLLDAGQLSVGCTLAKTAWPAGSLLLHQNSEHRCNHRGLLRLHEDPKRGPQHPSSCPWGAGSAIRASLQGTVDSLQLIFPPVQRLILFITIWCLLFMHISLLVCSIQPRKSETRLHYLLMWTVCTFSVQSDFMVKWLCNDFGDHRFW